MDKDNSKWMRQTGELPDSAPRHRNLARTLAREIAEGVYPVGSKLPREIDLCEQFGASRHTVRMALSHLVRFGLVERTRRLGTVVKATQIAQGYKLTVGHINDLAQFGAHTSMLVLDRELKTASGTDETALEPYEGQQWLHVTGLRHSNDHHFPISHHEVWVHPDYRAVSGVEGWMRQSIFDLVEEQFGVAATNVHQTIQSAFATDAIEKLLRLQPQTPCLWVRREYYDDRGKLIELSISVHPGDLFSYQMNLERSLSTPNRS